MIIINVHIHCNPASPMGKIRMLKSMKEYIGNHRNCFIYIMGDFNFVGDACSRVDLQTGHECGKSCLVNDFRAEHFADFTDFISRIALASPAGSMEDLLAALHDWTAFLSTYLWRRMHCWRLEFQPWDSLRGLTSVITFLFVRRSV